MEELLLLLLFYDGKVFICIAIILGLFWRVRFLLVILVQFKKSWEKKTQRVTPKVESQMRMLEGRGGVCRDREQQREKTACDTRLCEKQDVPDNLLFSGVWDR